MRRRLAERPATAGRPVAAAWVSMATETAHVRLPKLHTSGEGVSGGIRPCSCQVPLSATPKTDPRRNGVCRSITVMWETRLVGCGNLARRVHAYFPTPVGFRKSPLGGGWSKERGDGHP